MQKIDGYFPLYWDERTGALFIEIPRLDTEFLFSMGLAAGLGSNDIGLDRGSGGGGRVVYFQRVGPRVMLVQPNQSFRSSSANPLERKSVEDSFAKSILWGFAIAGESNGRLLVDGTDFLLRDVLGAANALRPGNYRVDRTRSAFYLPRTKGFPKNSEIEMTLTFVNEAAGGRGGGGGPAQGPPQIGAAGGGGGGGRGGGLFSGSVASVTPTPDAVTMREHVSLVELPDNNYKTRVRRSARRLRRHQLRRLQHADRRADGHALHPPPSSREKGSERGGQRAGEADSVPGSTRVRPRMCAKRCSKARAGGTRRSRPPGFRNAFKVDLLPDGADPMDIRYNMINWVHRSTRGWSSGGTVSDPRTGEIIKATVTLGSLRDRQDYMIFEGLLSPYGNGERRGRRSSTKRRSSASVSSPRTRSATRWASATTTTTAKRAGSR